MSLADLPWSKAERACLVLWNGLASPTTDAVLRVEHFQNRLSVPSHVHFSGL